MNQGPLEPGSAGETSSSDRNFAMLVHIGTLISLFAGGWLINIAVPLVGYLWKRESSTFVAEHAREELNFQISLTIYACIALLFVILTIGIGLLVLIPLGLIVGIVVIFVMIRAAVAASNGEHYRYPLTIRLVS